jgi:hypothetical protein
MKKVMRIRFLATSLSFVICLIVMFQKQTNVYATDDFYVIPIAKINRGDFSEAKFLSLENNILRFENVIFDGVHYWVHYAKGNFVDPIDKGELATFEIPSNPILIDGNPSDWLGINPLYTDPEGDQDPDHNHIGTDIKAVFIARDNNFLYVAFTLWDSDAQQNGTMYVIELQQYIFQYHTAGDTVIICNYTDSWNICVGHRESIGCSYTYDSSYIGIGQKFIEYKVPISDVEYDGDGEFDPMGIENRFIRTYAHYCPDDNCSLGTYDGAGEDNRAMIINFYP